MPSLISLACPNCRYNLAEENLHSNILQCPRCNSYTYYESGMYNTNVFFGLLRCQTYQLDKLRSAIIDKYVEQASLKAIWNIKYIHAERLLVPIREIDVNGVPKAVTLFADSLETAAENTDVRQLLQNHSNISSLFNMQNLHPLRLGDVRDEIDSSGYITRTTVLPVERTKRSVDTAYNLEPSSLLRILYLPVYRLSFRDNGKKMVCFANGELTGLDFKKKDMIMSDHEYEYMPMIAASLSILIAFVVDIVILVGMNVSGGNGFGKLVAYIITALLGFVVPALLCFSPILVFIFLLSRMYVSLNVITSVKKWLIRRILVNKFRLNEIIR